VALLRYSLTIKLEIVLKKVGLIILILLTGIILGRLFYVYSIVIMSSLYAAGGCGYTLRDGAYVYGIA